VEPLHRLCFNFTINITVTSVYTSRGERLHKLGNDIPFFGAES
jgi:hypothetical protein